MLEYSSTLAIFSCNDGYTLKENIYLRLYKRNALKTSIIQKTHTYIFCIISYLKIYPPSIDQFIGGCCWQRRQLHSSFTHYKKILCSENNFICHCTRQGEGHSSHILAMKGFVTFYIAQSNILLFQGAEYLACTDGNNWNGTEPVCDVIPVPTTPAPVQKHSTKHDLTNNSRATVNFESLKQILLLTILIHGIMKRY